MVTGALGQIGTELVEALREKHGASAVIASDIRSVDGMHSNPEEKFLILDVVDTEAIIETCKSNGVGTIYHLAALLAATGEKNPELCRRGNVGGTVSILEAAKTCSLRVFILSLIHI